MGSFSRSNSATPSVPCPNECGAAKAENDALVARTQQRADGILAESNLAAHPPICRLQAPEMKARADRYNRYSDALPGARAAQDMNKLGDQRENESPVTQPCLTRLPLDADALNRELGIDPNSPGAIKPSDLEDRTTGYRAAMYRDEATGRNILVARDTDPSSLVDWKTNIENGAGIQTDQYKSISELSRKLHQNGVPFDAAGYSKGGGLAQQAGLMSPDSNVYVFNSAGLNDNSLQWAGQSSFDSLTSRTRAFSAEGDFLTFMNETTDPELQVVNANYLRGQLRGENAGVISPMKIRYESPANMAKDSQAFINNRDQFLQELDGYIDSGSISFPPVRAASREDIPNSMSNLSRMMGGNSDQPRMGKLNQHKIDNVVGPDAAHPGPMENQMAEDLQAMEAFKQQCG